MAGSCIRGLASVLTCIKPGLRTELTPVKTSLRDALTLAGTLPRCARRAAPDPAMTRMDYDPEHPAPAAPSSAGAPGRLPDVGRTLGIGAARPRLRRRYWLTAASLLVAALLGYGLLRNGHQASAPSYRTEPVRRGDLTVVVSATGNVQPTNEVEVGSELSGTIESVFVDDNDRVKRGQVLAQLDVSRLQDQIAKSRGALAAAQAAVAQTVATTTEKRLYFERLDHMGRISKGTVPSKSDIDTARAALDRAIADEASARAAVVQARAALSSDETNLAKASIRSPIDGVVLARNIEPGQTVAASLQAPVLFTLAENLSQMELQVDVDEADVGQVRDGQKATFTVDAYPNRSYPAAIRRVGFGSQTKDGVVSYLTVLTVDNSDLSLRPGMTATAQIVTTERRDVLLVPSAALRFAPAGVETATKKSSGSFVNRLLPRPPARTSSKPATTRASGASRQVWILRNGEPVAVAVTPGATDGRVTEIVSGDLAAGTAVITELAGASP